MNGPGGIVRVTDRPPRGPVPGTIVTTPSDDASLAGTPNVGAPAPLPSLETRTMRRTPLLLLLLASAPSGAGAQTLAPATAAPAARTSVSADRSEGGAHARPPVFVDLSFEDARARAAAEHRLLVLDAMTSWCGPCKVMDETTWRDAALVAWLRENAIPIQLDMDLHEALKSLLDIHAFPTIVVFDGDREDRVVGLRDAAFMAAWLDGFRRGVTRLDALRARYARVRDGSEPASTAERMEMAEELADDGLADEALAECRWLWDHAGAERLPQGSVRAALVGVLWRLRDRPEAHALGRGFLDEAGAAAEADPSTERVRVWLAISRFLGDTAPVVAWAEALADGDEGRAVLGRVGLVLFSVLADADAWDAAGWTLREVPGDLVAYAFVIAEESGEQPPPGEPPAFRPAIGMGGGRTPLEQYDFQLREDGGRRYAALLAAGRIDDAARLAEFVLAYVVDGRAARAALVDHALRAARFDARADAHRAWLREAWQ